MYRHTALTPIKAPSRSLGPSMCSVLAVLCPTLFLVFLAVAINIYPNAPERFTTADHFALIIHYLQRVTLTF